LTASELGRLRTAIGAGRRPWSDTKQSADFIGTRPELKQRIAALAEAGFTHAVFSIPPR
jgi:hypothetical protein